MSRSGRWLLTLALLILLGATGVVYWSWRAIHQPFGDPPAEGTLVEISPGATSRAVLEELEEHGVLRSALLARLYLVQILGDRPLKAGEYRFLEPLSVPEVLEKLSRGEVETHPVTVLEGLTLEETARGIAKTGFGTLPELLEAMRDPSLVADLDPLATDLEGYLFPDTYAFARAIPPAEVVRTLVSTFRRKVEGEILPLDEEAAARSLREVVVLASIVEKEALLDKERPIIAGVYANRLRRGIALHADPTIIFALKRLGTWDGDLRRKDLTLDSPYNTYLHPGLPPGPICSPGLASLAAAARPADVPYLYFVSRNDGSHVFARTLSEHNRNVYKWQKLYWRERRSG